MWRSILTQSNAAVRFAHGIIGLFRRKLMDDCECLMFDYSNQQNRQELESHHHFQFSQHFDKEKSRLKINFLRYLVYLAIQLPTFYLNSSSVSFTFARVYRDLNC